MLVCVFRPSGKLLKKLVKYLGLLQKKHTKSDLKDFDPELRLKQKEVAPATPPPSPFLWRSLMFCVETPRVAK